MGVHDQLAEQAPAYVLGALTPAERRAFEAHLAGCAVCAAEVRSLTPVAAALAHAAPEASPAAPVPPLAALAPDCVYHIAGISKCLSPALRIAYLVLPDARIRLHYDPVAAVADALP